MTSMLSIPKHGGSGRIIGDDHGAGPILSEQWYRIAALCPRLNPQASIRRVAYRGKPWIVMVMPDGRDRVRLNAPAWAFFGRCSGSQTSESLWQILVAQRPEDLPSQDELLTMTFELWRIGALTFDRPADFGLLNAEPLAPRRAAPASSWMAWRVPLGCPDALFARLDPLAHRVFGRAGLVTAVAISALGAALAVGHLDVLGELLGRLPHSPNLWLATWIAFVALKLLHEAAHGLALRRFGLPVPEWGFTLMLLTPVPYVDAGPADGLPSAANRFVVSAAGLLVEGSVAVLALLIAIGLPAGAPRDFALVVFMVGAVSSWAVNANPLLRFDGYFAVTDLLELPNLASRSAAHWTRLSRRALRMPVRGDAAHSRLESALCWVYAPASWGLRAALAAAATAWFAQVSPWLAIGLGTALAWSLLFAPALRGLRALTWSAPGSAGSARARTIVAGVAGVAAVILAVVPVQRMEHAGGVVWLTDDRAVRTATGGLVVEAPEVREGRLVVAGEPLFRLDNPELAVKRAQLDLQIAQLQTERADAQRSDLARAQRLGLDLATREAERERVEQRLRELDIRATHDGHLVLVAPHHWSGRVVSQGTTLAWVAPLHEAEAPLVRVAMPATRSQDLTGGTQAIWVTFASNPHRRWSATLERDHRTAQHDLPSAALSDRFGGGLSADPADPGGSRALQRVVLLDVRLAPPRGDVTASVLPAARLGERAEVSFVLEPRPLGLQAAESVRRWWHQASSRGAEP